MHNDYGRLPLLATRLPGGEGLNKRLRDTIWMMSISMPGKESNMADGSSYFENKWLSQANLHESDNPDVRELTEFIEETANRAFQKPYPDMKLVVTTMWALVSRMGMAGSRHNHAGLVSGAYYVDAGSSGATDGGLLQFYLEPGLKQPTHRLQPESGQVFLFPGSLEHSVSRY